MGVDLFFEGAKLGKNLGFLAFQKSNGLKKLSFQLLLRQVSYALRV